MNLIGKIKETGLSVFPIILIVLLLKFTWAPITWTEFFQFFLGGIMIVLGLGVFLLGTDIGIVPVGHDIGSRLVRIRKFPVILLIGFFIGFLITVAEPDVQVLANQVARVDGSISGFWLVTVIGLGVGLFVALGFARTFLRVPYHFILLFFYGIVFLLAGASEQRFLGIAFDAGGATTGPMTVPFIIALGLGVAAVRKSGNQEQESFGMVGLASIGPILAVLLLGFFASGPSSAPQADSPIATGLLGSFTRILPEVILEVTRALGPLAGMFLLFQLFLLRMSPRQIQRTIIGLVYAFFGLVMFLVGVNGGFLPVGSALGAHIGGIANNGILIPIGLVLGALVVLAEPAVWILNQQIEEVSGGHIRKRFMLVSLSAGVAFAVGLAMLRVVTGINIWWLLGPGYALALFMTFFCPPVFTAIAFDSGGVASGPMASTFILSFTMGASATASGGSFSSAFGVIAMIAMTPLITIQGMGMLLTYKLRRATQAETATGVNP